MIDLISGVALYVAGAVSGWVGHVLTAKQLALSRKAAKFSVSARPRVRDNYPPTQVLSIGLAISKTGIQEKPITCAWTVDCKPTLQGFQKQSAAFTVEPSDPSQLPVPEVNLNGAVRSAVREGKLAIRVEAILTDKASAAAIFTRSWLIEGKAYAVREQQL